MKDFCVSVTFMDVDAYFFLSYLFILDNYFISENMTIVPRM